MLPKTGNQIRPSDQCGTWSISSNTNSRGRLRRPRSWAIQTHEAAFGGLIRTTISYYTYIIPYSLGRKYTYNTEIHPRIIFNGIYVPRGAFSQSFRALAAKEQKLWLLADWSFFEKLCAEIFAWYRVAYSARAAKRAQLVFCLLNEEFLHFLHCTISYLGRTATWWNLRRKKPKTSIAIRSTVISNLDKINKQMR